MAGPEISVKIEQASKDRTYKIYEPLSITIRNIFLVLVVGIIAWCAATALELTIHESNAYLFQPFQSESHTADASSQHHLQQQSSVNDRSEKSTLEHAQGVWIFLFVILAGALLRGALIRSKKWHSAEGDGATSAITYFLNSYNESPKLVIKERYQRPCFIEALRRWFITVLTLGCGGSGGIEGPSIPIGESIGAGISRIFRVIDVDTLRALQVCGIAAAVCALLNAPFAAAIFAMEVVFSERIIYRTFIYSVFSVIVAYTLNQYFFVSSHKFVLNTHAAHYSVMEYFEVTFVAIFCSAPAGLGLKYVFVKLKKLFDHLPVLLRAPLGAFIAAMIALGLWFYLGIEPQHVLGISTNTLTDLLNHQGGALIQVWWILLIIVVAKTLTTGLTLMTGGSAGLLIPSMILGGSMGGAVYYLLHDFALVANTGPQLFVVAGIASSLVAVLDVPLASIALIVELFGARFAPPAMVAVGVCHLFVRYLKNRYKFT